MYISFIVSFLFRFGVFQSTKPNLNSLRKKRIPKEETVVAWNERKTKGKQENLRVSTFEWLLFGNHYG